MSSFAIDLQSIIDAAAETVTISPNRGGASGYGGRTNQPGTNECFMTRNRHYLGVNSGIAFDKVLEGATVSDDMFQTGIQKRHDFQRDNDGNDPANGRSFISTHIFCMNYISFCTNISYIIYSIN